MEITVTAAAAAAASTRLYSSLTFRHKVTSTG